jgi:ABC-type transport system involved in multi-copper enzyme maturation permease subunit
MTTNTATARRFAATPVQKGALIVGIVFLLVGIMGFIPGVTTGLDTLQFAGHESEAMLLGIFQVSILHNLVHLLFGVLGIALARTASASKAYLVGGGIIYAVLWIYGLFFGHGDHAANFVPLNNADNWLHLALAVGMIALGLLLPRLGHTAATARR